jgi:hypothetical protein
MPSQKGVKTRVWLGYFARRTLVARLSRGYLALAGMIFSMRSLVVILYVLSALLPVAGLLWAWSTSRRLAGEAEELVARCRAIRLRHSAEAEALAVIGKAVTPEMIERNREELRAAGEYQSDWLFVDFNLSREYATAHVLRHLANKFIPEVSLVVAGLVAGAAGSLLSLYL